MSEKKKLVIPKGAGKVKQLGDGLRAKQTQAPSNIKKTCRFDYQPEICKDYYETGYCGYGDNCKFIHDRSLTKSSLILDKEYEETRKRQAEEKTEELKKKIDKEIEEKKKAQEKQKEETFCSKCNKAYDTERTAMLMKCHHMICCDCAIGCKKCPVCDASTGGVFKAIKKNKK